LIKKALGLRRRKVGTVPAKADPDAQAAFLKDELAPRLEEVKRGERSVLFVDAAHFVYGPYLGYLWCLVRLFVPGPCGRKRYNVLGAINAVTHQMIRVTNHGYINTSSVCDLLKAVSRAGLPGPVTLVLDNAAYQRNAFVQAYAAFLGTELLYLPSYSPNLNLIERVWRFVKKEVLAARVKGDYDEFTKAIDDCLGGLHTKHAGQMATLLTLKFQQFDEVPVLAA
jgi:transposase